MISLPIRVFLAHEYFFICCYFTEIERLKEEMSQNLDATVAERDTAIKTKDSLKYGEWICNGCGRLEE